MASRLPIPKSFPQVYGDMLATFMSKIGVNDLNTGSAVTSFFEAMAQAVYRAQGDTFAILRDFSVDRAEGEALQRIREEEGLPPIESRVSTGLVTISDSSFTKIATKVYAGTPSPNVGTMVLNVSDASLFTPSGSIYIGRGTPNVEGPIVYNSIVNVGSYYQLNLDTPTTKYHNNSESVILAQGGTRNVDAGEAVRTVSSGSSPAITFTVTRAAVLLDGEDTITNVPVAAEEPGTSGNVPRNSIREFVTPPFTGAIVTNPNPFTTGRNEETDEEVRIRIKKARISRGLGTAIAIKNAVLGAQAQDENAVVTSNEIFSDGQKTTLFIDNGEGYEEKVNGVGLEFIVDSALGGEQFFQLSRRGRQTSIAKAFLNSTFTAPFDINPNDRLSLLVGGILSEHVFQEGDFRSNGFANAFEVVASINSNSDLKFSARTINNGTGISLSAKEETGEFLEKTDPTVGIDAGVALGIPTSEAQTLRLYKNNIPLSRNGRSAVIESNNQVDWSNTIASGDTLILSVDKTQAITYTFTNADFLAEGTYQTVSNNNSLQSWVNVINAKVTGVTASINGNRLVLTSNLGTNSRAQLSIDSSSTLVSKGMFNSASLLSTGREADFTLSRNTAQLRLNQPLAPGDSLTAGSDATQGTISTAAILGGSLTLAAEAQLWFVVDNPSASLVTHNVGSDTLVHFTKEGNNILRFRSDVTDAFANVQVGDYVVIWTQELNVNNRLEGRVYSVGTDLASNDYFEIKVTPAEYAAAVVETPINFQEGLSFVRSSIPPYKVVIAAGSYNINTLAQNIQSQLEGVSVTTENDEFIILTTDNKANTGSVLVFTLNDAAKSLNFTVGDVGTSDFSHYGFFQNNVLAGKFPLFVHSHIDSDESSDPVSSYIPDFESAVDLAALGIDPNVIVCFKHPYLTLGSYIKDAQAIDQCVQVDDISGTTVSVADSKLIKRLRENDRYWLANPLDFDFNDSVIIVLDNDASNKTFPVNLYRRAITNNTMSINSDEFRAYDVDSGATTQFSQFFGSTYSFKNYKALMRAKNVLDPNSAQDEDAILYRSAIWGRAGERYNIGYIYPTNSEQPIGHTVIVGEETQIRISLKSGLDVTNTIDGTTEWDITITPNSPVAGVDEVTYTWNSTGTNPNMPTLVPGNYVTINSNGEFSPENQGTFRISSATSTSFTVLRPNGAAVAENDVATLTTNTIYLFEDDDTTAQEIVDYVNDNLSEWISAELVDDNGSTGAGVINESTWEDNDFASGQDSIYLLDGINWIESSTLSAAAPNPQFRLKRTLDLPYYDTNTPAAYAFNDEEELRLIPTTIEQLVDFLSVLAVTGFSTLGEISVAQRDQVLQLASQILGSSGSVRISGGRGNSASALIIGTSNSIGQTGYMKTSVSRASSAGISVDQWVRLQASNRQVKTTGISVTTNVTVQSNTPSPNTSTIELGNRDATDRYFGQPRNHIRDQGRAFHVEKHGSLVCISWDGQTGSSPAFSKNVEFNDAGGGNMSVAYNGDFSSTEYTIETGDRNFSEVSIGDVFVAQNFADDENNGTFVVNGISDDKLTISVNNIDGVDAASAAVAPGDISITTEVLEGDTIVLGAPFANLNQGIYRVIRRYENSIYIENDSAVEERVVVASNLRSLGFDATTEFDVTAGGDLTIEWNGNGTEPTLENARMGDIVTLGSAFNAANQGSFMVTESGDNYIRVANSQGVSESGITVSSAGADILESHISSMVFSPYENTVAGDRFVVSGDVLGEDNEGIYIVNEVLSKSKIVVNGLISSQVATALGNLFVQVYMEESEPYYGYKKIYGKSVDPANIQRINLIFDTDEQFNKINESGAVSISSIGKLGFSENTFSGFDAYKYHTGLIAEANRITYGDPRDNVTYPGVSAAGAEIFIEPPLVRRITVSINVRVQTGVPFSRITEQVRNNIAALINSTDIGVSIAISDIISTVNSIPGVRAVSISSPSYDPTNDIIVVNPAEKPFILDIVNDIAVSKVGS